MLKKLILFSFPTCSHQPNKKIGKTKIQNTLELTERRGRGDEKTVIEQRRMRGRGGFEKGLKVGGNYVGCEGLVEENLGR